MKKSRVKFSWLSLGLVISLMLNGLLAGKIWWQESAGTRVAVIGVVDGDTVDFSDGTRGRLIGIDAPEYPKGCLSKQAKARLEELVLGKEVEVVKTGERSFQRDLVWVKVDGINVNKVMVGEGMATKDEGFTDEIEMAENEAKSVKRGIWSSQCTAEREGCVIKGNFHKGTKDRIYHLEDCYNYKQVVINPNEGDKWFCSEKEAEAAGFVKSKDCPKEK